MRVMVAIVLLLAACGPAASAPVATPRVTTPIETIGAAPTLEAAPSLTPAPTPAPIFACGDRGAGPLPEGWLCTETARHDLDGDSWPDVFVLLTREDPTRGPADDWRARAVLTNGTIHELDFAAVDLDGTKIRGFVDVDRDGRDDALVELDRGASTKMVGVFGIGPDGLAQAAYEDGTKARLLFAGSVRHGAAVECRSRAGRAELVQRGIANYRADDQWDWSESVYTWSGKVLVLAAESAGVIKVERPFDFPADADLYWGFSCFGIFLS